MSTHAVRDEDPRANLLVIMADQFRPNYFGAAGADFVNTPNIDRIAASGTMFTNLHSNCPICAPARIGLASGRQPANIGALGNDAYYPMSQRTYYQTLRDNGYQNGLVGKLDLAKPDPYNGLRGDRACNYSFGFTHPVEIEGKMHAAQSQAPRGPYGAYLRDRGRFEAFRDDYAARKATPHGYSLNCHDSVLSAQDYSDEYIGRRSVEWLQTVPAEFPWHLFVSFVGPHDPFDPPTEYAERYRNAEMPPAIPSDSIDTKPNAVRRRHATDDKNKILETRRQYCAEIELIDHWVGRILSTLRELGMAENTYVVFTSDHGEMLGDFGLYTKNLAYDASWRVPLLISGPSVPAGRSTDALIELIDLYPTLHDLAGVPHRTGVEAQSFASLARGESASHRENVVCRGRGYQAIRDAQWKYIETFADEPELYQLSDDPDETVNLAASNPDLVSRLRGNLVSRHLENQWRR
jgi:choline-sulfatase